MEHEKNNLMQNGLLVVLYGLIILMIAFSFMAAANKGVEGYNECVQEKCDRVGQEFCSKFRELNNCCQGAGGNMRVANGAYTCQFS